MEELCEEVFQYYTTLFDTYHGLGKKFTPTDKLGASTEAHGYV